MKVRKVFLLCVLFGIILAGCKESPCENEHDVWVYFSANPLSKSLKSTASPSEAEISKLILYGVDDKNVLVKTFPAILNPSSSGVTLSIPMEVCTLYAIANPSAG